MVNPFELTPAEKEEQIRDMIRRGYSYSQIMKECHVSPTTISKVKKELLGSECDDGLKNAGQTSKEAQALKLFSQRKSLLDVAIELDIPSDSVIAIYQKFLRLSNIDSFLSAYGQVEGNIEPFLRLFNLMNVLGMTPNQVAQLAEYGFKLPHLYNMCLELSSHVQLLNSQKKQLGMQLNSMQNQVEQCKGAFDFYDNQCQMKKKQLTTLVTGISQKKNFIERFDSDEGYTRIKEAAKIETRLIMQNNQAISAVTLSATLEAVRRYPYCQKLLFDIVTSQNNSGILSHQPWMESHTAQLLEFIQQVQNEMAERMAGIIVRNMESIPK